MPRVEIETSKGKIEIVLFEDDAPNTVASFISLVENGLYNGTPFHRIVPHFVAQGGDPDGTGEGGPGYAIKLEATRNHFRGSLGMARGADKDSAGSQFYFCLAATTTFHLNTLYAVFGRISKGLEVADALRLGDKIIKARVISKRAHEYKVEKLPEKQE
ncbi:MAG: peptidylprolyl isomerase [Planctomycetes bacterium]|nr:peptidylprolyl isomerase [Planctomycetota bacterium]